VVDVDSSTIHPRKRIPWPITWRPLSRSRGLSPDERGDEVFLEDELGDEVFLDDGGSVKMPPAFWRLDENG